MFDPAQFRTVATHCMGQSDQAFHRTSIGRSYYSVFMQLDRYVKAWPGVLRKDRGNGSHNKTINALTYVQTSNTRKTVGRLETLKRLRTSADYDQRYSRATSDSRVAITLAKRIAADLDTLEARSPV